MAILPTIVVIRIVYSFDLQHGTQVFEVRTQVNLNIIPTIQVVGHLAHMVTFLRPDGVLVAELRALAYVVHLVV